MNLASSWKRSTQKGHGPYALEIPYTQDVQNVHIKAQISHAIARQ